MNIQASLINAPAQSLPAHKITDFSTLLNSYGDYLEDESKYRSSHIDALIFPRNASQISEIMKEHYASRQPVTLSGARTGITGGAVAQNGSVLSLEHLNGFKGVYWNHLRKGWSLEVEAGITLDQLRQALDQSIFDWPSESRKNHPTIQAFEKESSHWFYPPDPTEKNAQLGGTLATNASGAASLKFGQTRDWINGITVILSNGDCLKMKRGQYVIQNNHDSFVLKSGSQKTKIPLPSYSYPKLKCSAGYYASRSMDFIDYFIGSEGTLGVITEVDVQLAPKPEVILGCVAFFKNRQNAIDQVPDLKHGLFPAVAIEYFDDKALGLLEKKISGMIPREAQSALYMEWHVREKELDFLYGFIEETLQCHDVIAESVWAADESVQLKKMKAFRHAVPETINSMIAARRNQFPELKKISTDFVMPADNFPALHDYYISEMQRLELEYALFGHIGSWHLHLNILPENPRDIKKAEDFYFNCAQKVVDWGGTLSGEHGIGKLKKKLLAQMYPCETIEEMKKIKRAFDPADILGKGTLF